MPRKLLWIGDAVVSSGFARATHKILETVRKTWDVAVLGINYPGDPHPYPYPIYPAAASGGDAFGIRRTAEIASHWKPELVVVQNDPWNIPAYLKRLGDVPTVGFVAVDGKNCQGLGLNGLAHGLFWTEFARKEAHAGGYTGTSAVVPLGVDLTIYKVQDRAEMRQLLFGDRLPKDAYIVGNVNRNQPRKRLDLLLAYFAEWVKGHAIDNAYLMLHVAPTGDVGFNIEQLARYYGIPNRVILVEPEVGYGISEEALARMYAAFDVMATTTQGEGWGLPTMEGMACGIPQIVPKWSALGEWTEGAAAQVPCTSTIATHGNINTIGGVADRDRFIETLQTLYQDSEVRLKLGREGVARVQQARFRWENIGVRVVEELEFARAPERLKACS